MRHGAAGKLCVAGFYCVRDSFVLGEDVFDRSRAIMFPGVEKVVMQLLDHRREKDAEQLVARCFGQQQVELEIQLGQHARGGHVFAHFLA